MNLPGPIPIPPSATPALPNVGGAQGIGAQAGTPGADFSQKIGHLDPTHGTQKIKHVEFPDGTDPLRQASGIREEIARIRNDYEAKVATGQIDTSDGQLQLWRMMDLQTRAQDVQFRVELITKLVEHAVSGVKQLQQTQT